MNTRNTWALIALLFTSACGKDVCLEADMVVDGLCVKTNGYQMTPSAINMALIADENTLQRHGLPSLNIVDLMDSNNVGLILKSPDWDGFEKNNRQAFAGFFDGWNIYLAYDDSEEDIYSLMHEVLHAVAALKLDASNDDNYYHRVPYVFKEWSLVYHPDYHGQEVECGAAGYLDERLGVWNGKFCTEYPLNINSRDNP